MSSTPQHPLYKPYKDPFIDHQDPQPTYPLTFPRRKVDAVYYAAVVLVWILLGSGWAIVGWVVWKEVLGVGLPGIGRWLGWGYVGLEVGTGVLPLTARYAMRPYPY
jgi:hypothetical protein